MCVVALGLTSCILAALATGQATATAARSAGVLNAGADSNRDCGLRRVATRQVHSNGYASALSADHRYAAVYAYGGVGGDDNEYLDVQVVDRKRDTLETIAYSNISSNYRDYGTFDPDISAHGALVSFHSRAPALVPRDSNEANDVFLRDRRTGSLRMVSRSRGGGAGNGNSLEASLSGNGRYVLYYSEASNLVREDTNDSADAFLYDRRTGRNTRVSVTSNGAQVAAGIGPDWAYADWYNGAALNDDGSRMVFTATSGRLARRDGNQTFDVFMRTRAGGRVSLVSRGLSGHAGNGESWHPVISSNGQHIAFTSRASNLVKGDKNRAEDLFTYDVRTGRIQRIARASGPSLSRSGRYLAFSTKRPLSSKDDDRQSDVYVRDRACHTTTLVSSTSNGGFAYTNAASLSGNGRNVLYTIHDPRYPRVVVTILA
jgi:hypothetical protein